METENRKPDSPEESEEALSLEESFSRLEEIVEALEQDALPLEEAFLKYQQGMQLLKRCNEKIDLVEKKVQVMNGDGGFDEF